MVLKIGGVMKNLLLLAQELQSICENHNFPFCIIGGLALQNWGESRFTKDVDLTIITGFGGEQAVIDCFLEQYEGRIEDPATFAQINRVLLLKSSAGIGIDIALGALPFEELAVDRAAKVEMADGISINICSPEDLIIMKAFASRPQDWIDVEGILIRQTSTALDWDHIWTQLKPLAEAKEQPEIIGRLEELKQLHQ